MDYLSNAGVFLIKTLFGIYEIIILLRFLMQMVRADFYNPISQFVVKATSLPLKPLRRVIPGVAGMDMASLVLLLVVILVELLLLSLVTTLPMPSAIGLIALALVELLKLTINVFMFSVIILAILSWVSPGGYNPVANLLYQITAPLMRPARRMLPPMGGLDLSPMVVIIVLYLLILLLVDPLQHWAGSLAYGHPLTLIR
ncbi:MAG: YggT family protein [Gammaproteobacteria bacterium]|nr:YggT family protein [Gammaproteobacteria bacterium]